MPRKVPVAYRKERIAWSKQYIEIGMMVRDYICKGEDTREIDVPALTWIATAVALGHAENRPMTSGNVAEYLKLDRVTAKRKLDKLVEMGAIVRDGDHYFLPPARASDPPDETIKAYANIFMRAADVLLEWARKMLGGSS